jgi:hypothetical protein
MVVMDVCWTWIGGSDEWFLEKGPLSYFVAGCAAKK